LCCVELKKHWYCFFVDRRKNFAISSLEPVLPNLMSERKTTSRFTPQMAAIFSLCLGQFVEILSEFTFCTISFRLPKIADRFTRLPAQLVVLGDFNSLAHLLLNFIFCKGYLGGVDKKSRDVLSYFQIYPALLTPDKSTY